MSRDDGHALFAAVAQVLYHGATSALKARQHIWELRHGAAWMWLQYWRNTAEHAECSIDAIVLTKGHQNAAACSYAARWGAIQPIQMERRSVCRA